MLLKIVPVALVATALFASAATAQNRRPAENPPAGYAGQQYVDSRGCLFIRAGHGGQTSWVARIDRTRKPICGMTPSANTMAAARQTLQSESAAPVAAAPPQTVQPRPVAAAAPRPAPQPVYAAPAPVMAAPVATHSAPMGTNPVLSASRTQGCPAGAPYGQVYQRAGSPGGTILVCGSQPPSFQGLGAVSGTPGGAGAVQYAQAADPNTRINYAPQFADQAIAVKPPAGYKQAWTDDRLNPNRARGTVGGHQQMQQIWTTNEVPQRGVNEPRKRRWYESAAPAPTQQQVVVSTKSVPQAVSGARFVQVGSFGVPANADRAVRTLQSMGLPVQVSRSTIKGKPVQVVRAGPFGSDQQAQAALGAARSAGFGDAILRR
jgi:cell division septation protein DedD